MRLVISAFLDDRAPDRQRLTQEFWNQRSSSFRGLISTAVLQEIEATPSDVRRQEMFEVVCPSSLALARPGCVSAATGRMAVLDW